MEDSESTKCSTVTKRTTYFEAQTKEFFKWNKKIKPSPFSSYPVRPSLPPINLDPPTEKMYREFHNANQITSEQNVGQEKNISSKPSWPHERLEKSSSSLDINNIHVVSKAEKSWMSLLEQCPSNNDKAALCEWLVKVISTSEDFENIMNHEK